MRRILESEESKDRSEVTRGGLEEYVVVVEEEEEGKVEEVKDQDMRVGGNKWEVGGDNKRMGGWICGEGG